MLISDQNFHDDSSTHYLEDFTSSDDLLPEQHSTKKQIQAISVTSHAPSSTQEIKLERVSYTYEYSKKSEFLTLGKRTRQEHGIFNISLALPVTDESFGGFFSRFILHNIVGYDTVIFNALEHMFEDGYVRRRGGAMYSIDSAHYAEQGTPESRLIQFLRLTIQFPLAFAYYVGLMVCYCKGWELFLLLQLGKFVFPVYYVLTAL